MPHAAVKPVAFADRTPDSKRAPTMDRRRSRMASRRLVDQFNWQLAGLLDVNSALVPHSGWSMNGLRLPWKL
jgi:hypothetical protein